VTDGIRLFIGPICSEAAIGAALPLEIAALMISPTATHPLVTVDYQGQTRPTVFRISYSYEVQAQATAHFARAELGASRAALLAQPGDDYSTYLAEQFAQQFMAEGGQVVYRVAVSPGAGDLTNILTAIQQSGAELIYLPGTPAVVNQVAAKLQEPEFISSTSSANPVPLLLGSDGWESDKLDLPLTEGSYFPVHYLSTEDRAIVQDWLTRYKAVYSVEPTTLAALSYDAANILAEAIAQAGSFEPAAIAEILEKTEFKVVTGPIRFDRNHNPIKPVSFVQVQNNSLVYITSINPGGAPR
jgi:branched-chain amino acid transport system substrate-binding protein